MLNQTLQFFIGLRSDHEIAARKKCRHGVDTVGGAPAPVFINGIFEAATYQNVGGFIGRQAVFLSNLHERLDFADIFYVDKIGAEERIE